MQCMLACTRLLVVAARFPKFGGLSFSLGFACPACAAYSGVESLPSYVPFQPVNNPPSLRQQFPGASDDALDLLASMVALDPSKRPSGETVIRMTL